MRARFPISGAALKAVFLTRVYRTPLHSFVIRYSLQTWKGNQRLLLLLLARLPEIERPLSGQHGPRDSREFVGRRDNNLVAMYSS